MHHVSDAITNNHPSFQIIFFMAVGVVFIRVSTVPEAWLPGKSLSLWPDQLEDIYNVSALYCEWGVWMQCTISEDWTNKQTIIKSFNTHIWRDRGQKVVPTCEGPSSVRLNCWVQVMSAARPRSPCWWNPERTAAAHWMSNHIAASCACTCTTVSYFGQSCMNVKIHCCILCLYMHYGSLRIHIKIHRIIPSTFYLCIQTFGCLFLNRECSCIWCESSVITGEEYMIWMLKNTTYVSHSCWLCLM